MSIPRLSAILDSILVDTLGLPAAAIQVRLLRSWGKIVGPHLAGKTFPGKVRNGVLTVYVPNHAWAQELQLSKPVLLERIRSVAGEGKVQDIRFTVGSTDRPAAAPHPGAGFPRREEDIPPPERDESHDAPPPPEPSGLDGVRDPETREILRSICRKSSRRKG